MRKTLAIIIVSTIFGGLFGSYLTINHFDQLPWSKTNIFTDQNYHIWNGNEENIQDSVINVVNNVSPAVVSISISKDTSQNIQIDPFFDGWPFFNNTPQQRSKNEKPNWQKVGGGTGFIITEDGYILTNKHVVADKDAKYAVTLSDGTEYEAELIGTDLFNDVGALKIDAANLATAELGDSDKLVIGQTVVAIGNALAEFSNTVTTGVVSGISRSIVASDGIGSSEKLEGVIQTDAAINPGNSGGPLISTKGKAIGINAATVLGAENVGFAIPINTAKKDLEDLKKYGKIRQPFLGLRYILISKELQREYSLPVNYGALVISEEIPGREAIIPKSPADKAGVQEADIILEIQNKKIDLKNSLQDILQKFKIGDKIGLKILRNNQTISLKAILTDRK